MRQLQGVERVAKGVIERLVGHRGRVDMIEVVGKECWEMQKHMHPGWEGEAGTVVRRREEEKLQRKAAVHTHYVVIEAVQTPEAGHLKLEHMNQQLARWRRKRWR